jgi:predicted DNA repair protein MutK
MFLVGGGILEHGIPPLHHAVDDFTKDLGAMGTVAAMLADAVIGIVAGALVLAGVTMGKKLFGRRTARA